MSEESFQLTLEAARVNAGFTQTEAAKKLGITQTTLSGWENNSTSLSYLNAQKIGKLYGVAPNILFFGSKNEFIRFKKHDLHNRKKEA